MLPGRAVGWIAAGLLLAVPLAAAAAEAGSPSLVIDFESAGPMRELLARTISVAKTFLPITALVAYAVEAFGASPTAPRDYGAVTWRVLVVVLLLWNYPVVFGEVIALMNRLESDVAANSTWEVLTEQAEGMRTALGDLAAGGGVSPAPAGGAPAGGAAGSSAPPSWAYDILIGCVQILAEAAVFLVRWMSRILTATLYILGPLALVAGIPRQSSTGTRWFQRFVTIASWPIFSTVLLAVTVAIGAQGATRRSYLECLVASLVLLATSLATPTLASHVVGGTLGNFAAAGLGHARNAWSGWRRWVSE